jgi:hypothetical protein
LGCNGGSKAMPTISDGSRAPGRCGEMGCTQYDTARAAFADVVATRPQVLAVGEAHAPRNATAPSAAKRFAEDLLPTIAPLASDLLVELMMPPGGCADATEEVREKQTAVTTRQAATDQNEYVVMGEKARSLGVVPDMLRPSCADLDRVRAAGDEAIGASLELIAHLTLRQATRLVERDARSDADAGKMVVVYGGLLHNDLAPSSEAARWSYAPALQAAVGGRLVAVDLVVPEFIGDDASWASLAWRPYYDRERLGGKATLFRTGERSYVLVFPAAGVTGDAAAAR